MLEHVVVSFVAGVLRNLTRTPLAPSLLSRTICVVSLLLFPGIAMSQNAQPWPENPDEAARRPQISGPHDRPAMTPDITVTHKPTEPMTCLAYAAAVPVGNRGGTDIPLPAPPDITFAPFSRGQPYQEWHCSCNNVAYLDENECIQTCRTSMACFAGICSPVQQFRPQVCVKATAPIQFAFGGPISITIVDWNLSPGDQAMPACKAAAINYANFLLEHETHHATDMIADLSEWNSNHAKDIVGPVEACADTLDAAEKEATAQITSILQPYWQNLKQTIFNTSHFYHYYGDAIGLTSGPDCSACPARQ